MADQVLEQQLEIPTDIGVDAVVDDVLRTAAWIGSLSSDETFCSFTSILLALLRIDPYSGDFARRTGVDIPAIRAHRGIDEGGVEEARQRAAKDDLPQGKPMYSVSARNILGAAADIAREGGSEVLGAHHLFLAYLFRSPQGHLAQMQAWRFDPAAAQDEEVRQRFDGAAFEREKEDRADKSETAEEEPRPAWRVPGTTLLSYRFSDAARSVLRAAISIAQLRAPPPYFIASETLLEALVAARATASDENADLTLLGERLSTLSLRPSEAQAAHAAAGNREPFGPDEALPELSTNLNQILNLASQIAQRTRSDRVALIGLRHLAAGLFIHEGVPPTIARKRLIAAGANIASLRREFVDHIAAKWPADDLATWRSYLLGEPAILVSSFDSDNPLAQSRDLLDVAEEAKAFARLTASRKVDPPLSIGIFGDWGAGKTFFMDRLYEHVETIARDYSADDHQVMFYKGIVQIRFNAWHYIETNLWASLVEFIFDELDRWLRPRGETERIEALFDQLATSRQLKLEALQELVFTRQQREAAKEQLEEARTQYEAALVRHKSSSPRAFWRAVAATFAEKFTNTAEGREAVKALDQVSQRLGLPHLRDSGGELVAALKDSETQAGRARVIGRGLLQTVGGKWWWLAVAVALIFVPVGLAAFTKWLGELHGLVWFREIGSATIGFSSVLAVVAGCIGWGARRAKGALDTLERFHVQLDAAVMEETANPARDFAKAEREVAVNQAAVTEAEQQYAQAEQRVRDARRELESGTARGRLNRFIRDKVVAGDYAKHLGIVATIRKDFDQLARIMDDAADARQRAEGERLEIEHQRRVEAFIAQYEKFLENDEKQALRAKTDDQELRLFRRIILYIDDLDRCPPAKVIEVLQAIHLLLYFKLFVVVVAVDSRWISRALTKSYPGLIDEGTGLPQRRAAAASAHDYLEKIFQIPYWVRPMDVPASERFMGALVGDDRPQGPQRAASAAASPVPGGPPVAHMRPTQPSQPTTSVPELAGPRPELPHPGPEPSAPQAEPPAVVNPRLETLALTPWEAELMRRLAPFLGQSPRRAKRFVNVYRLVKTGLPQPIFDALVGERGGAPGYRALLTQLAIVTGAPQTAQLYFTALRSVPEQHETLEALSDRLAHDQQLTDAGDWYIIQGALAALLAFSRERGVDIGEAMVQQLRSVASIASRYSFLARR